MIDAIHQPLTNIPANCPEGRSVCARVDANHHGTVALMLTAAQSRGARGLLNWSQVQLAEAAGVSIGTVRNFEAGRATPIAATIAAIHRALENAGVEFLDEDGVRLPLRS